MWFRRKQKNQRFNRRHVLDVKLRSDQVRATRVRWAALTFGILFATGFGLYLVWCVGEWTLDRLVYENSSFAIQEIKVQTDGVISPEQLRSWSGAKIGDNLFALKLEKVKGNLKLVPMIRSVSIERILPHTLRVSVEEREPVAQVNVQEVHPGGMQIKVYHVDADGYVMLPLDPRNRAVPLNQQKDLLPVISGIEPGKLVLGRRIELPQLQAALQLIMAFEHSPMAGLVDLRSVDVSSARVLVATTDQNSQITFGLQDLDKQLLRWRAMHDFGKSKNNVIATLNLAVSKNVPAVFVAASTMLPASPRPVPPSRNSNLRRRNV